jgi:hypothetical protein
MFSGLLLYAANSYADLPIVTVDPAIVDIGAGTQPVSICSNVRDFFLVFPPDATYVELALPYTTLPDPNPSGLWCRLITIASGATLGEYHFTLVGFGAIYSHPSNRFLPGEDLCALTACSFLVVNLADSDGDGVTDHDDNCPAIPNGDQADSDDDTIGDVCDVCPESPDNDQDNDAVCSPLDNCPQEPNSDQSDLDHDGVGDECDNCTQVFNPSQSDSDGDGTADACDTFPFDPDNEQAQCETDLLMCLNSPLPDEDGDGEYDGTDVCAATTPGSLVDSDGCSLAQFCGRARVRNSLERRLCRRADWRNDEPLMTGRTQDCTIDPHLPGPDDDECVPRQ